MSEVFVGAFLGVLGSLATQRFYDWYKDKDCRKKLKENLRSELEQGYKLLVGQGHLLPTSMWKSTVTSGDVKLLSFSERTKLAQIYFKIDNHNYEAKRVRDVAAIVNTGTGGGTLDKPQIHARVYWQNLSMLLADKEELLKIEIEALLQESFWTS